MSGDFILLFLVLFPMLGAAAAFFLKRASKKISDYAAAFVGIIEFAVMVIACIEEGSLSFSWQWFAGFGVSFEFDGFRRVYGLVIAFMWMMTLIFSLDYFSRYEDRSAYWFFNLVTLGATVGVFFSADLYTTFIFFEIMTFTSFMWVAFERSREAIRAANTYLAVAVIGGMIALFGMFLLQNELGTLNISALYPAAAAAENKNRIFVGGLCMLLGFGAKAGMFPLHIWLPKAHPVAPAPASALLSGILTKTGIFGILVVSANIFRYDAKWGAVVALFGVITMVLGAVLAILSGELKRTLACSSMSQIGFILVGVGMMNLLGEHNILAARGVLMHMVNHSLFKLLLFMVAGVIAMKSHKLALSDIRGFGANKPLLKIVFLIGAAGISGIPLLSGYVSKTLLHESIVEYIALSSGVAAALSTALEWVFLLSGGMTVAYMAKLYTVIFVHKPAADSGFDKRGKYMSRRTSLVLVICAAVILVLGVVPNITADYVMDMGQGFLTTAESHHAVSYFSFTNLKGTLISVAIGAVIYFAVVRRLIRTKDGYITVDTERFDMEDKFYRVIGRELYAIFEIIFIAIGAIPDLIVAGLSKTVLKEKRESEESKEHRTLAYQVGSVIDATESIVRGGPKTNRTAKMMYTEYEALSRTTRRITRNLSFALIMACIGICLTLLFLILR